MSTLREDWLTDFEAASSRRDVTAIIIATSVVDGCVPGSAVKNRFRDAQALVDALMAEWQANQET